MTFVAPARLPEAILGRVCCRPSRRMVVARLLGEAFLVLVCLREKEFVCEGELLETEEIIVMRVRNVSSGIYWRNKRGLVPLTGSGKGDNVVETFLIERFLPRLFI